MLWAGTCPPARPPLAPAATQLPHCLRLRLADVEAVIVALGGLQPRHIHSHRPVAAGVGFKGAAARWWLRRTQGGRRRRASGGGWVCAPHPCSPAAGAGSAAAAMHPAPLYVPSPPCARPLLSLAPHLAVRLLKSFIAATSHSTTTCGTLVVAGVHLVQMITASWDGSKEATPCRKPAAGGGEEHGGGLTKCPGERRRRRRRG